MGVLQNKKKVVVIFFVFVFVCSMIYFALRSHEYDYMKEIDVSDYTVREDAVYGIEDPMDSDYFFFTGYCYFKNTTYQKFEATVALRDTATDVYYAVPTQLYERPDLVGADLDFSKVGFYARVSKARGDFSNRGYELCYLADIGGEKYLVHTGYIVGTEQGGEQ